MKQHEMAIQPLTPATNTAVLVTTLLLKQIDQVQEATAIRHFVAQLPLLVKSLRLRHPASQLQITVGFGAAAWRRLFPQAPQPPALTTFQAVKGPHYMAPATTGDLLLHLRASSPAVVYAAQMQCQALLTAVTTPLEETTGFRYFNGRTLLGFLPEVTNPPAAKVLLTHKAAPFQGGSYVLLQKYIHKMAAWQQSSAQKQAAIYGLDQQTGLPLPKTDPPAHWSLMQSQHPILRLHVPYAAQGVSGTLQLCYARNPNWLQQVSARAVQQDDPLLAYTVPISGSFFFVPAPQLLTKLGRGH
uniref:Predicted dye-decolorizing peroxidase (DyP), encapsulated subgroup n=1 Tax=Loigolactobacillus rennini TaxID=238013 RepID=A0A1K2I9Z5_9LACO|nr:Predicted dye-decolorizing peroxidase (DyP), encapsulated subgroup [Loigolactobacillus rennini]